MANLIVKNSQAVVEELKKLADTTVKRKLGDKLAEIGDRIRDKAKKKVPVDSGDLKDSIVARMSKNGNATIVFADYPKTERFRKRKTKKQAEGSRVYYAFAVEYGTKSQAAQPFLKPTLNSEKRQIKADIQEALGEAINNNRTN